MSVNKVVSAIKLYHIHCRFVIVRLKLDKNLYFIFSSIRMSESSEDELEWRPPTEAEKKVLAARRERSDKVTVCQDWQI